MAWKLSHIAAIAGAGVVAVVALRAANPSHRADAAVAAAACRPGDFTITDLAGSRSYSRATLNGSIVSHCAHSAAVQLLWTEHNPDGTVSTFPFLAHDGAPIAPGESYLFTTSAQVQSGPGAHYTVTVDGIRTAAN